MSPMRKPSSVEALKRAAAPPAGDPVLADWDRQEAHERAEHAKAQAVKPARITLNLPPDLNRQLQQWTVDVARYLDESRVSQQDALRAIIRVITKMPPEANPLIVDMLRWELAQ